MSQNIVQQVNAEMAKFKKEMTLEAMKNSPKWQAFKAENADTFEDCETFNEAINDLAGYYARKALGVTYQEVMAQIING